jgi:hypothetical protein
MQYKHIPKQVVAKALNRARHLLTVIFRLLLSSLLLLRNCHFPRTTHGLHQGKYQMNERDT